MTLYRVERPWCGMNMTEKDIDAAGFRAIACLQAFPDLHWIRTYYDPEGLFSHCFYETERPELIREHAEVSRIPCGEITRVLEITPAMWAGIDPLVLKAQGFDEPALANPAG